VLNQRLLRCLAAVARPSPDTRRATAADFLSTPFVNAKGGQSMEIDRTVEEYVPRALTPTAPSDVFAEMVRLVRKYANDIQAEKHRQELLDVALQCELPTVEERACWGIQQIRVANALPAFVVEALEEMVRRAMRYAARAEIYEGSTK
jgi:hypothetical protein